MRLPTKSWSKLEDMGGIHEWNRMEWDGMGWHGMEWDGMGWNGMEWDEMGWNGMECNTLQ